MAQDPVTREEVAAKIAARGELGPDAGLAIVSLGTGIPITAIAAEQGGVAGIALAWLGINVAHALRR
jgi:hypothetical protein